MRPINCAYSVAVGMPKGNIALSTVPPDAAPAPCMRRETFAPLLHIVPYADFSTALAIQNDFVSAGPVNLSA